MASVTCFPEVAEGKRLQDLAGLLDDIYQALRYIEVAERQVEQNSRDIVVWEAATSAAVVVCARCFADGIRERLPHQMLREEAPSNLQDFHEYVIALRSKHIAHSVSLYEENQLRVHVELYKDSAPEVTDVRVESQKMLGIGEPDLPSFRGLCEWLVHRVSGEYQRERDVLLTHLRSLPVEEVLNKSQEPLPSFFAPGSHRKSRSQK